MQLLQEEMRRVCRFFESREAGWMALVDSGDWTDGPMIEGHRGYARQQAEQFRALRARCKHLWRYVNNYVQIEGEGVIVPPEVDIAEEDDEDL